MNFIFIFVSFCSSLKVLSKYVIIFLNISRINILIIVRRKSDANMHVQIKSENNFLMCEIKDFLIELPVYLEFSLIYRNFKTKIKISK